MAESREDRIMKLATSLKASGFAKTDSQARMLAEDMIGTEDKVQQRFEEQHNKTQEFLKTAKNLKEDRTIKPEPKKESAPIQPIKSQRDLGTSQSEVTRQEIKHEEKHIKSFDEEANEEVRHLQEIKKEPHHGSQSLSSMMLGQIEEDHHDIKTIEDVNEEHHHAKEDFNFSGPIVEEKKEESMPELSPEIMPEESKQEEKIEEKITDLPLEPKIELPAETNIELPPEQKPQPEEKPQLDANKLVEMMEEDGKMEEHTREIKEKPKIIKPKEEYAENNIDLGAIFGKK